MARHHVIISGTGRAGTTLLVQLLTALRFDTGFDSPTAEIDPSCNAGMETDIRNPNAPYIIKSPWLCDSLREIVKGGEIVIDHAIVPVRDLFSAAQSRREVSRKADPTARSGEIIPGGLWHTDKAEDQEDVLARQLYELLYALAEHAIPLRLLHFPRLVNDPKYLFHKIRFLLADIEYDTFLQSFRLVARPELVHDFHGLRGSGLRRE